MSSPGNIFENEMLYWGWEGDRNGGRKEGKEGGRGGGREKITE